MKKLNLVIIVGLISAAILFVIFSRTNCIGCGSFYTFSIEEGCELAEKNFYYNYTKDKMAIHMDDELLDGVVVKDGFPNKGLQKVTLREYCQRPYYPCPDRITKELITRCNLRW